MVTCCEDLSLSLLGPPARGELTWKGFHSQILALSQTERVHPKGNWFTQLYKVVRAPSPSFRSSSTGSNSSLLRFLSSNQLSGPIPEEIYNLVKLTVL